MFQAPAHSLAEAELAPLFGLVGDANLYMVDSFVRDYGGKFLGAAHEAGGVLMVLGALRFSEKSAWSVSPHGPAITNTVTALVEGVKSFTPLVLMCGDKPQSLVHSVC